MWKIYRAISRPATLTHCSKLRVLRHFVVNETHQRSPVQRVVARCYRVASSCRIMSQRCSLMKRQAQSLYSAGTPFSWISWMVFPAAT